ncbi:cysteine-rich CWC family protein [Pseudoduganella umbonata]|uniref:Cysteine-rich CWC family protein n=1 Tax=Pseudoduganella umbonata TaxID=864828 RepID=A0A4P8HV31_9BURK|nr:cysteine-rich CWC family protein [Pseudoduganella umbonata]MBB3223920.1 hypothetical protein [Pseudoduganella umbonata]QCP12672.1 hypothetical protein FCL38_21205 [Pseudoduganella umbonata]
MSTCERCGATFHCAMVDGKTPGETPGQAGGDAAPCWCTLLPPAVPVPRQSGLKAEVNEKQAATPPVGCWCPDCLKAHIAALRR